MPSASQLSRQRIAGRKLAIHVMMMFIAMFLRSNWSIFETRKWIMLHFIVFIILNFLILIDLHSRRTFSLFNFFVAFCIVNILSVFFILDHYLIFKMPRMSMNMMPSSTTHLGTTGTSTLFVTVLTAIADAFVCTKYSALVALAVLFEAARLLAMTSLGMVASLFCDLGFESLRVPLKDWIYCSISFHVSISVAAILAIAVGTAT